MTISNKKKLSIQSSNGFALLITLITIGAVLAVTLSLVELSLKQLSLAVDSRDGEIAFQAANAGLECAQRIRRVEDTDFNAGNSVQFKCFGVTQTVAKLSETSENLTEVRSGEGSLHRYQANIEWGGGTRCSEIDMVVMISDITAATGIGVSDLKNFHYSLPSSKTCPPGSKCTIAVARGYNSPCARKTTVGVLRREILLEF